MNELPAHVVAMGELTGVVATVDEDGKPHTAPFGSIRAVSASILRFACDRRHRTYANLVQRPEVTICVVLPPDIAISVNGRASVLKESMETMASDAVVEIQIDDVKDDMLPGAVIESGVVYSVPEELRGFLERYQAEVAGA